mmetsp:Transcript_135108/g.263118  ORF Transcript_135108/g.263118 Transcript_135108/m.263118 type:complete len:118 (+) Transcript_135108:17-370(+)
MQKVRDIWNTQIQSPRLPSRVRYIEVYADEEDDWRRPLAIGRRRNWCRVSAAIGLASAIALAFLCARSFMHQPQRPTAANQPTRFFNHPDDVGQVQERWQQPRPQLQHEQEQQQQQL